MTVSFDEWWAQFQNEGVIVLADAKRGHEDAIKLVAQAAWLGGYERMLDKAREIMSEVCAR